MGDQTSDWIMSTGIPLFAAGMIAGFVAVLAVIVVIYVFVRAM